MNGLDLIHTSLGKYQIKQAASYSHHHMKLNSSFTIFTLPNDLTQQFFASYSEQTEPILLMAQLESRHRSKQTYDAYVLVDKKANGRNCILGYCCECYVGLRTVGCCSHVMCIIWAALYLKDENMPKPAGFLDNYFDAIFDEEDSGDEDNMNEDLDVDLNVNVHNDE